MATDVASSPGNLGLQVCIETTGRQSSNDQPGETEQPANRSECRESNALDALKDFAVLAFTNETINKEQRKHQRECEQPWSSDRKH